MKLCRFDDDRIGLVRGRNVHDVSGILDALPPLRYPVPFGDQLSPISNDCGSGWSGLPTIRRRSRSMRSSF
jgi:hypothetical protein